MNLPKLAKYFNDMLTLLSTTKDKLIIMELDGRKISFGPKITFRYLANPLYDFLAACQHLLTMNGRSKSFA